MNIDKILNEETWEEFLGKFPDVSFLQSFYWGEFQRDIGKEVERIEISGSDNLGAIQYYILKTKLYSYIYCPRGPIVNRKNTAEKAVDILKSEALEKCVDFIIVEPDISLEKFIYIFSDKGFKKQATAFQPECTSIINLDKDTDTLFSQVRKTTRAMIRKAENNNIIIESFNDLTYWEDFSKLLKETFQRQQFTPHTLSYIKKQFELFSKRGNIKLYIARQDKNVLVSAIILSYGGKTIYLHAASGREGRNIGASHLLVWKAILDAKEKGDKYFDFWGIAPSDDPNHPWSGITVFKQGFGGETVSYPGTYILPVKSVGYNIYLLIKLLRSNTAFKIIQRNLFSIFTKR